MEGAISPRSCDVFKGEKITYLFYGRPSYKMPDDMAISKYWQLPAVFVYESDVVNFKRIFPFDSGAYVNGLYPKFIDMMELSDYELSGNTEYPGKLISSFFVNPERYFRMRPRDRRDFDDTYEVEVTDEEIKALYELISHNSENLDDRRFAIELQSEDDILIGNGKCKAIVIPEEYLESDILLDICKSYNIEIMSYPSFPLKQEMYYHTIYNAIFELYRSWGLVR
ncbi:MAG: hypothetical protein R3D83_08460 [Caenibius sp.]